MIESTKRLFLVPRKSAPDSRCHILIGVTDSQTCLTLTGRLIALREAGFRVTLVSSPGPLLERTAVREGIEAFALPMQRDIAPLSDLVSLVRLWWLILRLKPDLTEFSTPKAGFLGGLASLLARVPVRVYMLRGLKLETSHGIKRAILQLGERVAARCVQVVLCNSPSMLAVALNLKLAPESKFRLLGDGSSNGVDADRFTPGPSDVRRRLGIPDEAPLLGFVGRLTRDKGIPDLLQAFNLILQRRPDAHLLLVGWFDASDDALDSRTRARIESHPRIHSAGFVSDTAPFYRAMDLLILPTRREGFPNVVLEAAASGVPVITTLCTGARDSVISGVTGLLIPPGHPEAIGEAVLQMLRDPEKSRHMGAAARAWVVAHFADDYVLELAVAFYANLLKGVNSAKPAGQLRVAGGRH